ncbi:hypothetical protein V2A60_006115 [Cordyceps javanica]|uniref:Uncharacterized protein n=1 Tax=Cordyceps javanica TaxID=43265 RepID=A0A545UQM4_9HYPO|nr:hypothetical protein IF1G_09351 [Cordyceps javanica]TQW03715.1 hypothetical protein IF2G_08544 [Cordyceps javanica]
MANDNKNSQTQAVEVAVPEKATLSTATTVCVLPVEVATPRSERSSNPFDTDVEAALISQSTTRKSCNITRNGECQVWPGKQHWKDKAKDAKIKRSCTYMSRLNRRQKIAAKILLIALIIGIAVGVGFGVSKPLGAPIWGKKDS